MLSEPSSRIACVRRSRRLGARDLDRGLPCRCGILVSAPVGPHGSRPVIAAYILEILTRILGGNPSYDRTSRFRIYCYIFVPSDHVSPKRRCFGARPFEGASAIWARARRPGMGHQGGTERPCSRLRIAFHKPPALSSCIHAMRRELNCGRDVRCAIIVSLPTSTRSLHRRDSQPHYPLQPRALQSSSQSPARPSTSCLTPPSHLQASTSSPRPA